MTLAFDALDSSASPLARVDPRWKLLAALPSLVCVSMIREPACAATALALSTMMLIVARFSARFLATRVGAMAVFLAPFLIILPLQEGRAGILPALTLAARALSIVFLALALLATSPFADMLKAAQSLGAPSLITRLALLTYRYVFVLADDFVRMRTAVLARGFRNRTTRHSYATVGRLTGALLVRSAERAERVAHAMHCRGFDGKFRALNGFHTRWTDVVFCVALLTASAIVVALDLLSRS